MMFLAILMRKKQANSKKKAADTIRLEKKKDRPNRIRTQWTKYNRRNGVAANMRQK